MKPLVVDGSVKSHAFFLAYDHISLSELEALQEFINHSTEFHVVVVFHLLRIPITLILFLLLYGRWSPF